MKIIASDYDGTLNYGGIDDAKRNAISRWRSKGNLFGLVSGRCMQDVIRIYNEKAFECDFLVANNGALICDTEGNILSDIRCCGDIALPLIKFLFNLGCPCAIVNTDNIFRVYPSKEEAETDGGFTAEDMPEVSYFNQISTFLSSDTEAEHVAKAVYERFGAELNPLQNGNCLDIVSYQVNKASGIYNLLKIVGAEYDDVITVGDNINDADMIKEFRSYAMENAVDFIKENADFEIKGITELIERESDFI